MEWVEKLNQSMDYIEEHLANELGINPAECKDRKSVV